MDYWEHSNKIILTSLTYLYIYNPIVKLMKTKVSKGNKNGM